MFLKIQAFSGFKKKNFFIAGECKAGSIRRKKLSFFCFVNIQIIYAWYT